VTEADAMCRTPDAVYELADDSSHPIPRVYAYDTALTFKGGGAYLGIVIATPLDATSRSLMRLREKRRIDPSTPLISFNRSNYRGS
jgi:hypothetical protein